MARSAGRTGTLLLSALLALAAAFPISSEVVLAVSSDSAETTERAAPCPRIAVVGHRGAPGLAPENTLASFDAALRAGADWLEADVLVSKDGVPVVIHDPTVDRVTGGTGRGRVADLRIAELDRLSVRVGPGGPQPIPRLTQLLDRLRGSRARLLLEIKDVGRAEDAAEIGRLAAASGARVELYSFYPQHLRAARSAAPGLPATLLQASWYARDPEGLPLRAVSLENVLVTPERIRAERAAGRRVYAWTVDDPAAWDRLAEIGADAVITDDPGAARARFDRACPQRGEGHRWRHLTTGRP
ncbi:glycerophosphodiester phosphodiesterase [Kitasatospora sp. NPDC096147]|uniref:glycerophosphodiester phosphodiesterase n=1 Tax=Kitasatospora sp. NPDC096147 TaxID=3364093 RepID=UPI00381E70BA